MRTIAALVGILTSLSGAAAQNFPTKPVTIVVPFAAGGPADAMARVIGDRMRVALGRQVIIEDVAGAGGSAGSTRTRLRPVPPARARLRTWPGFTSRTSPARIFRSCPIAAPARRSTTSLPAKSI